MENSVLINKFNDATINLILSACANLDKFNQLKLDANKYYLIPFKTLNIFLTGKNNILEDYVQSVAQNWNIANASMFSYNFEDVEQYNVTENVYNYLTTELKKQTQDTNKIYNIMNIIKCFDGNLIALLIEKIEINENMESLFLVLLTTLKSSQINSLLLEDYNVSNLNKLISKLSNVDKGSFITYLNKLIITDKLCVDNVNKLIITDKLCVDNVNKLIITDKLCVDNVNKLSNILACDEVAKINIILAKENDKKPCKVLQNDEDHIKPYKYLVSLDKSLTNDLPAVRKTLKGRNLTKLAEVFYNNDKNTDKHTVIAYCKDTIDKLLGKNPNLNDVLQSLVKGESLTTEQETQILRIFNQLNSDDYNFEYAKFICSVRELAHNKKSSWWNRAITNSSQMLHSYLLAYKILINHSDKFINHPNKAEKLNIFEKMVNKTSITVNYYNQIFLQDNNSDIVDLNIPKELKIITKLPDEFNDTLIYKLFSKHIKNEDGLATWEWFQEQLSHSKANRNTMLNKIRSELLNQHVAN